MLRKVSLSAMAFTYLFAGAAHFTRLDYFAGLIPDFLPSHRALAALTGTLVILLAPLLPWPRTRGGACFGLLFLLALTLPFDFVRIFSAAGSQAPFSRWEAVARVPFHLLLMLWVWWHSGVGSLQAKMGVSKGAPA